MRGTFPPGELSGLMNGSLSEVLPTVHVDCKFQLALARPAPTLPESRSRTSHTPSQSKVLFRPSSSQCSHRNNDRGSVLGGRNGSRDEPLSRAKGR